MFPSNHKLSENKSLCPLGDLRPAVVTEWPLGHGLKDGSPQPRGLGKPVLPFIDPSRLVELVGNVGMFVNLLTSFTQMFPKSCC